MLLFLLLQLEIEDLDLGTVNIRRDRLGDGRRVSSISFLNSHSIASLCLSDMMKPEAIFLIGLSWDLFGLSCILNLIGLVYHEGLFLIGMYLPIWFLIFNGVE